MNEQKIHPPFPLALRATTGEGVDGPARPCSGSADATLRWARWSAVGVALLAALAGCSRGPKPAAGTKPVAGPTLTIGAIFPLSGGAGRIGEMKRQGADLAVAELNAAGGVNGRTLQILYADSKNSTTEAGVAFSKLVDVDHAPVVMSAMSQVSLALAGPADRKQVVLFANASHPELTKKSPFVFRNLPSTKQTATVIAETAYRDLDLRRVAILHVNDEYGNEAARVFEQRFTALGGQVLGSQSFEIAGTDFRPALGKLARAQPDAWWIPGYGASLANVLKQKSELKLPGQVLCDLGLVDSNVIKNAAGAADRAAVVAPDFDPTSQNAKVQAFVKAFEAKYQETPSFDAAFQYDAVYLIADAAQRAKTLTGEALRQALQATSGFVGVCGPTAFGEDREAALKVVVKLLVDGRLQPLEKLTAAPPPKTATKDRRPTDATGQE